MRLKHLLQKVQNLLPSFLKIKFFHILRDFNGEADIAANEPTLLRKGTLTLNGIYQIFDIP